MKVLHTIEYLGLFFQALFLLLPLEGQIVTRDDLFFIIFIMSTVNSRDDALAGE